MTPSLSFWIFAWCLMGLAFVTATGAILFGAIALDRQSDAMDRDEHSAS